MEKQPNQQRERLPDEYRPAGTYCAACKCHHREPRWYRGVKCLKRVERQEMTRKEGPIPKGTEPVFQQWDPKRLVVKKKPEPPVLNEAELPVSKRLRLYDFTASVNQERPGVLPLRPQALRSSQTFYFPWACRKIELYPVQTRITGQHVMDALEKELRLKLQLQPGELEVFSEKLDKRDEAERASFNDKSQLRQVLYRAAEAWAVWERNPENKTQLQDLAKYAHPWKLIQTIWRVFKLCLYSIRRETPVYVTQPNTHKCCAAVLCAHLCDIVRAVLMSAYNIDISSNLEDLERVVREYTARRDLEEGKMILREAPEPDPDDELPGLQEACFPTQGSWEYKGYNGCAPVVLWHENVRLLDNKKGAPTARKDKGS